MVSAFSRWKRYDETRQNLAKVRKLREALPLSIHMDDQVHVLPKFVCLPMNLTTTEPRYCIQTGTAGDDSSLQWTIRKRLRNRLQKLSCVGGYLFSVHEFVKLCCGKLVSHIENVMVAGIFNNIYVFLFT